MIFINIVCCPMLMSLVYFYKNNIEINFNKQNIKYYIDMLFSNFVLACALKTPFEIVFNTYIKIDTPIFTFFALVIGYFFGGVFQQKKLFLFMSVVIVVFSIVLIIIANNQIIRQGYVPIEKVMEKAGYDKIEDNVYGVCCNGVDIRITYDLELGICKKNDYYFDISDNIINYKGRSYIKLEKLEEILCKNINVSILGEYSFEEIDLESHKWSENVLIAHAGGVVRESNYNTFYSNSYEAMIQNYSLEHRVFEFDFSLTSDFRLAAVHDWIQFGNHDGNSLSSEEWSSMKTHGSPVTEGTYTTMFIEDILDQMMICEDMYIVTDTKSYDISDEECRLQFQIIYDAAMERDPKLLDRVVPQIYNEQMYDIVMSVYDWPSIIYTVYAVSDSAENIIKFADSKDNIKVITVPVNDGRFTEKEIDEIHNRNMKIYMHTIHYYSDLTRLLSEGVDGVYTGLLIPRDVELYQSFK